MILDTKFSIYKHKMCFPKLVMSSVYTLWSYSMDIEPVTDYMGSVGVCI